MARTVLLFVLTIIRSNHILIKLHFLLMKNFTQKLFLMVLMAFAFPLSFYAQNIFSNEITGTDPGLTSPYTDGQVLADNVTAGGIVRGPGLTGNASNNRYSARDWNLTALDADDYFSFTITPGTGYALNFTDFQYVGQKSGTGPKYFAIRSSIDNYATDVYTFSNTGSSSTTFELQTVDLSGASFQTITSEITFRFYAWGGTGDAGTFSVNSFAFNGTVALACAEVALPTAAAQAFCGSGTVANLTATGENLQWYAAATEGTALEATTALTTTTYYVSQTVNGCESERLAVSVTVNAIPDAPVVVAESFCGSGTVADLDATGENIQWYADATGGVALAATTALATGNYYASQTVNGCESARAAAAVTVNELPATPTGNATQDFEEGETLADLDVTGTNVVWYADAALTTELSDETVLVDDTTYYAVSVALDCYSAPLAVTVNQIMGTVVAEKTATVVYPNPVQEQLYFEGINEVSKVEVFNLLGQAVIAQSPNAASFSVDMSQLAKGNYVVKVLSQNGLEIHKVVKQ
jgi:Secretion system C-terminal sorting domain/Ig-like domain CHU_C associated